MKGQQISPWSIYNPHLIQDPLNVSDSSDSLACNLNLPPISTKRKLPKQHSAILSRSDKYKKITSGSNISFSSFRNQSKKPVLEQKTIPQVVVTEQQLKEMADELNKKIEQRAIRSLIFHQMSVNPEQHILIAPTSEEEKKQIKKNKSIHRLNKVVPLPKINPKIDAIKSCILNSCQIGFSEIQQSGEMNQQMMNKILKQKIQTLISQKMKVLSKRKQLIQRKNNNNVHNFF